MTSVCPDNNRKPEVIWYFKLRGIKSINSVNLFFESQMKSGDDLYYSLFVHSPNITKPFSPTFLRSSKLLMFLNTLWSCMITIRRLGRAIPFWFLFHLHYILIHLHSFNISIEICRHSLNDLYFPIVTY